MTEPDAGTAPALIRRDRIKELVDERGFVKVAELSVLFGVSEVTVRADLDALEAANQLSRVHGGAVAADRGTFTEPAFEEALGSLWDEKQRIARSAAALVRSGNSVIIDVGTTAAAFARALVERTDLVGVVVITNGLKIALELERAIPRFSVIVTGGTLRPLQHSLVNPLADDLLARLNADVAFIGCNGVDVEHGVTNINLPEAAMKQRMLASATRRVVLADGSKLGQVHLGRVTELAGVDALIAGSSARPGVVTELEEAGLHVTVV